MVEWLFCNDMQLLLPYIPHSGIPASFLWDIYVQIFRYSLGNIFG